MSGFLKVGGNDPDNIAKGISVDSNGAVKVKKVSNNNELANEVLNWESSQTQKSVELPPSTSNGINIAIKNDGELDVPITVSFDQEIEEGVYIPWCDGEGNKIEAPITSSESKVVGVFQGFPRFLGGRINFDVFGEPIQEDLFIPDGRRMYDVVADSQGYIYTATHVDGGIKRHNNDGTGTYTHITDADLNNQLVRKISIDLDDNLYAGNSYGLYKFNSAGTKLWDISCETMGNDTIRSILVHGNFVYVGSANGHISKVDTTLGNLEWTIDPNVNSTHRISHLSINVEGTRLFAGARNIYVINPTNGSLIHDFGWTQYNTTAFEIPDQDYIITTRWLGAETGLRIEKINKFDFALLDVVNRPDIGSLASPGVLLDKDNFLYIASAFNKVFKINPDNFETLFEIDILPLVLESGSFFVDNNTLDLYISSKNDPIGAYRYKQNFFEDFESKVIVQEVI